MLRFANIPTDMQSFRSQTHLLKACTESKKRHLPAVIRLISDRTEVNVIKILRLQSENASMGVKSPAVMLHSHTQPVL